MTARIQRGGAHGGDGIGEVVPAALVTIVVLGGAGSALAVRRRLLARRPPLG